MTEFRGTPSTNQITAGTTEVEIIFGTEDFDTDTAFASNRLTVPAGWNGEYGEFYCGFRSAGNENGYLLIQKSVDSGSNWTDEAKANFQGARGQVCQSGPVALSTGDIWRALIYGDTGINVTNEPRTFFSGRVVSIEGLTLLEHFRAHAGSTQAIPNNSIVAITVLTTEDFDEGANLSSGVYTVPADLNGGFGIFTQGFANTAGTSGEDLFSYIQRSTDGGSTYPDTYCNTVRNSSEGITNSTGPVALVTGHKYRCAVATDSGGFTLEASDRTFFAGELYKT